MGKKKTDDGYDWANSSVADAIRQASQVLGGERSPKAVIRWLADEHGIHASAPQVSKVLKEMYQPSKGVDTDLLRTSLAMVAAVQGYADKHGGIEKLKARMDAVQDLMEFAETVGGWDNLKVVVDQLAAQK